MSTPRYPWWAYAKNMIRQYPDLAEQYAALHQQRVTHGYTDVPGGGGDGRPLENTAIQELPGVKQKEFDAVRLAIEQPRQRYKHGETRLAVIEYVFWSGYKGRRLLDQAAYKVNYSYDTVKIFHHDFIMLVAQFYGLLE